MQFGFVWQNGMMTPLPPLPGGHNSTATSDNNQNPGVVVGWAETGAKDPKCIPPQQLDIKAVVYEPGFQNGRVVYQPYKLPPVTGDEDDLSVAFGINDNGNAVGATGTCGLPIRPR